VEFDETLLKISLRILHNSDNLGSEGDVMLLRCVQGAEGDVPALGERHQLSVDDSAIG
jgi:hypothetical protein